jgi:hypothetical protein
MRGILHVPVHITVVVVISIRSLLAPPGLLVAAVCEPVPRPAASPPPASREEPQSIYNLPVSDNSGPLPYLRPVASPLDLLGGTIMRKSKMHE